MKSLDFIRLFAFAVLVFYFILAFISTKDIGVIIIIILFILIFAISFNSSTSASTKKRTQPWKYPFLLTLVFVILYGLGVVTGIINPNPSQMLIHISFVLIVVLAYLATYYSRRNKK